MVSDRFGKSFRSSIAFGIMALAILLAFSRAAWGGLVITSAFMLALMVLTSRSQAQRSRIIVMAVVAVILAAMLSRCCCRSTPIARCSSSAPASTRAMTRAASAGSAGISSAPRWRSICRFGIGPLQFNRYFPEDTHNSYLNAFMSGGWISGICYPALVFVTVIMGFRHIFVRVPWQRTYLAIFAAFLGTVGESFIIDTDHWRHFWMMLGAMWGMFAAAQRYKATRDQRYGASSSCLRRSTSNVRPA